MATQNRWSSTSVAQNYRNASKMFFFNKRKKICIGSGDEENLEHRLYMNKQHSWAKLLQQGEAHANTHTPTQEALKKFESVRHDSCWILKLMELPHHMAQHLRDSRCVLFEHSVEHASCTFKISFSFFRVPLSFFLYKIMGQNISITNHNGILKLKRNKTRKTSRTSSSSSSSGKNDTSTASSASSHAHQSKTQESSYQSSSIIVQDHEYIFPKASLSAQLDVRDLPYDTLKSEDDRMNAVCVPASMIGIYG